MNSIPFTKCYKLSELSNEHLQWTIQTVPLDVPSYSWNSCPTSSSRRPTFGQVPTGLKLLKMNIHFLYLLLGEEL